MSSNHTSTQEGAITEFNFDIEDLISQKELLKVLNIGRTTLWKWQKEGRFPAPVMAGTMKLGWIKSEVNALILSKQMLSSS